jgi:hypothetical protein
MPASACTPAVRATTRWPPTSVSICATPSTTSSFLLGQFQTRLLDLAEREAATPMPGFTHLQVAQPITFGHHVLAWYEMTRRDAERFADVRKRTNRLPLGAAALAGTTYPIDREFVAAELGFRRRLRKLARCRFRPRFRHRILRRQRPADDARLAHVEELVLWMNPRFGFVKIADRFCTGSSIMPQKKNPDVPELARGKTGRVYGHLTALLTLMKGQPLAYNKDNQEDKEPLFDAVDTITDTLRIFADMIPGITARPENLRDALRQGFRHGHRPGRLSGAQGTAVPRRARGRRPGRAAAEERGVDLPQLPLAELQSVLADDRRGRVRGAHRRRFPGVPQPHRRHRTGTGARRYCPGPTARIAFQLMKKIGKYDLVRVLGQRRDVDCLSGTATRLHQREVAIKIAFPEILKASRTRQAVHPPVHERGVAGRQAGAPAHRPDL